MKIKLIYSILAFSMFSITSSLFAQIPTDIDPGQNENSKSIYEQPEYIIPILTLFVILIGFYYWQKRKKK